MLLDFGTGLTPEKPTLFQAVYVGMGGNLHTACSKPAVWMTKWPPEMRVAAIAFQRPFKRRAVFAFRAGT